MTWIKDAIVDVLILLVVIAYAATQNSVIQVVLWVYTCLLMLSKLLAFFMPSLKKRANKTKVPNWFYHLIYALTLGLLIFATDYYLSAAWGIIWVFSVIQFVSWNKS